ncbi:hypothetical protein PVAND_001282 [Polypedilum vanderplanki]|uniref:Heat shock factor 2-binding protein n=1 Tax=Polypedilum vanderplanki TaxID=319348 RepID=A0A9J6BNS6_POLVA|nr:hypothetical protein PVAND_001282 [Polypedilum vanderplanki]
MTQKENEFNNLINNNSQLLTSAADILQQIFENFSGLLEDISKLSFKNDVEQSSNIFEINQCKRKVSEYIHQANQSLHIEIPNLLEVVKESKQKIIEYEEIIKNYENDIEKLTERLKNAENKCTETKNLEQQNTYSAAMGSTLAKMLWKTSKSQGAIQTYIDTGTMHPFLNLSHNTIAGFQDTYHENLPAPETFEVSYLLSLLGIYTNIVAQSIGRDYVLTHEIGVLGVKRILSYFGEMKMPSAHLLKRLILMFLYNLSITNEGAKLIAESETGIDNILKCLSVEHGDEIQGIALSLLVSLVNELDSHNFQKQLFMKLSQNDNFQKLMICKDVSLVTLCRKLLEKLENNTCSLFDF